MQLTITFSVLASLLSLSSAAPHPEARQVTFSGKINQPAPGTTVHANQAFPFSYSDANPCHDGYSQITTYVTDFAPTASDVNSSGEFNEGQYKANLGTYLIANFGLPPLSGSTPPPSTLTMPQLSGVADGESIYFSVIERATDCPPGNTPPQYGLTTNQLVYN